MDLSAPTSKVHQNLTDFKIHKSGKSFDNIHKLNQQVSIFSKNFKFLPGENTLTFSLQRFQSTKLSTKLSHSNANSWNKILMIFLTSFYRQWCFISAADSTPHPIICWWLWDNLKSPPDGHKPQDIKSSSLTPTHPTLHIQPITAGFCCSHAQPATGPPLPPSSLAGCTLPRGRPSWGQGEVSFLSTISVITLRPELTPHLTCFGRHKTLWY